MTKSMVEGIIIKLDNGNDLVLKVALDEKVPFVLNDLFEFNDFYQKYLEVTFINSLDDSCVIMNDLIHELDSDLIKQIIKDNGGDETKFDLDVIQGYDYLINNIIGIICGKLFGQDNGNGMIITIPTNHYNYFKDKIFFEVRGLDGSISLMNIVDFMNLISTFDSEPCTDSVDYYNAKYTFENRYTYFVITKYDTYTVIESYVTAKWE